jgi:hypothetical protein
MMGIFVEWLRTPINLFFLLPARRCTLASGDEKEKNLPAETPVQAGNPDIHRDNPLFGQAGAQDFILMYNILQLQAGRYNLPTHLH